MKGAGVVTVLIVAGGVWRAYGQGVFSVGKGPAYEPWKNWRSASNEGSLSLVRAAILSASPHNTQPWRFKVTNSWIELYLDRNRNVGALDPYLREEHIGMGCALENLMLAGCKWLRCQGDPGSGKARAYRGWKTKASGTRRSGARQTGSK